MMFLDDHLDDDVDVDVGLHLYDDVDIIVDDDDFRCDRKILTVTLTQMTLKGKI